MCRTPSRPEPELNRRLFGRHKVPVINGHTPSSAVVSPSVSRRKIGMLQQPNDADYNFPKWETPNGIQFWNCGAISQATEVVNSFGAKQMKRTGVGWVLLIVAGLTILYNVVQTKQNERQIEDHPWVTFFSGGSNLKQAYTFMPPYTGFEATVIAAGVVGGILIFLGDPPIKT